MSGRLIITGATNNPGRVFCSLIADAREYIRSEFPGGVIVAVRASSDVSFLESVLPEAEIKICDLEDVETLKSAFAGADTVVHIAGIHWSRNVADASVFCGAKRLIVVHTCGVYSKYKAAGEEYRKTDKYVEDKCRRHGVSLTILRPTMIYGTVRDRNMVKFIRMVDKLPLMPVVNGARYPLQPVHYKDVAGAILAVLRRIDKAGGKAFILSGEKPILLRDVLTVIAAHLGKRIRFISCPFWIAYPGAVFIRLVTFGKVDMREKVRRLCEPRSYPHDEATEFFGFAPRPFEDGIAEEIEEYKHTR